MSKNMERLSRHLNSIVVALFASMFSLLYVGWLIALVGEVEVALFITMQRADEQAQNQCNISNNTKRDRIGLYDPLRAL
jgi:hypothetical protein